MGCFGSKEPANKKPEHPVPPPPTPEQTKAAVLASAPTPAEATVPPTAAAPTPAPAATPAATPLVPPPVPVSQPDAADDTSSVSSTSRDSDTSSSGSVSLRTRKIQKLCAEHGVRREDITQHYQMHEPPLGKGNSGVVFKASLLPPAQRSPCYAGKPIPEFVAVKQIDKSRCAAPDAFEVLLREVRILRSMDHPNIMKMYESFIDDRHFYLVLELLPGTELYHKIEKHYYSEPDARNVTRQVASALAYMHSLQPIVAHRDLKLENLMSIGSGPSEIIKVIDFGFGKTRGSHPDDKFTTLLGSPLYVSPEIVRQDRFDERCDMWSLGVLVYIMLAATPPFYSKEQRELLVLIVQGKYNFDHRAFAAVSDDAKDFIRRLLVLDPDARMTAKQCLDHPWLKSH